MAHYRLKSISFPPTVRRHYYKDKPGSLMMPWLGLESVFGFSLPSKRLARIEEALYHDAPLQLSYAPSRPAPGSGGPALAQLHCRHAYHGIFSDRQRPHGKAMQALQLHYCCVQGCRPTGHRSTAEDGGRWMGWPWGRLTQSQSQVLEGQQIRDSSRFFFFLDLTMVDFRFIL